MRLSRQLAVLILTGIVCAACDEGHSTTTELVPSSTVATVSMDPLPPILIESLTQRHEFTDDVATQIRLRPEGRPTEVVNLRDASRMAVLRITVQPGARFPWHTHPGPVLVAVTEGELVYVYADDCVERDYPTGTAFVDPGSNVHFAFNRTAEPTVLIATFLATPATGPLTVPVAGDEAAALDAKCGFTLASHAH